MRRLEKSAKGPVTSSMVAASSRSHSHEDYPETVERIAKRFPRQRDSVMQDVFAFTTLRIVIPFLVTFLVATGAWAKGSALPHVMDGDIVFQISNSAQCQAVQLATQSQYSHCGIIVHRDGKPFVYEAVDAMRFTPLGEWIARGIKRRFLLMRLKDRDRRMTSAALQGMRKAGNKLAGKRYDALFRWSDETIYCSELVWKIYERGAGIRLAEPRPFGDYTLDKAEVRALIRERYGNKFSPHEMAVAPSDLVASPLLETVDNK